MDFDQSFLLNLTLLTLVVLAGWAGMLKLRDLLYWRRQRMRRRQVGVRTAAASEDRPAHRQQAAA